MVIFGARGDLTKRLLMPALFNLSTDALLDTNFKIVGVDHGDITTDTWVGNLTKMMEEFQQSGGAEGKVNNFSSENWAWITSRCEYLRGEFDEEITYKHLSEKISAAEGKSQNALFYIATAPRFFARVVEGLGTAQLLVEKNDAFRRVVIEKPFGRDVQSARELNADLLKHGNEQQFYRIDHFMGKEPVRGILDWRFGNRLFEPVWNHEHIDHVQITAAETIGVETRGPFYEATGALRDMIPSHLFSVLSMIAMEAPSSLAPEDVRNAHVAVLKSIAPIAPADAVRGQYEAGEVAGKAVVAYRDSDRVDRATRMETYAALRLHLTAPRWEGVPFFVRTGKALGAHTTHAAVVFKPQTQLRFDEQTPSPNIVHFQLSGRTGIRTGLLGKKPGMKDELGEISSDLFYDNAFGKKSAVGYEALLFDCMHGLQTLFLREDAIEAGWQAVEAVLAAWGANGSPQCYAAGSDGPTDAGRLPAASNRDWLPLR